MPWIDLEGAVNVRDLGALPTDDGGQTVVGRLLRADNLQELSSTDISRLVRDLGLTTVVDLRSSAELASEGPAPLDAVPSVRHVHHPVVPEIGVTTDVVAEALLLKKKQDHSRFPSDPTCGHYLGYLEDRPDQVVGAVRSIAHDQGAALVHCAAGKDRTGVVVSLALTAVGVRPEAVVADYAATAERTEAIIGRLRRSPTYARDIDSVPADAHRPRAETMAAFLEQVDSRYGGAVQWLTDHGLGDEELNLLRTKLRRPLPIRYHMGEPVPIGEHMLQAGALAEAVGAERALVAAALLHDIGHLLGEPLQEGTTPRYLAPLSGCERDRVRDSALTAVELCTLNATALPR